MTSERIPVIWNPAARSERSSQWRSRILDLSPAIEIVETEAAGHARELAREMASSGVPKIVVAGGDGTINEVVNGLVEGGLENGSSLGLLPTGTMNVFAAELGIPNALNSFLLGRCWKVIEEGITQSVDLWRANEHHFVQLAGVGLDAEVIKNTPWDLKKKFGPLSYVVSAVRLLAKRKAPKMTIRHPEGGDIEGVIALLGNGQRYGGPFKVFRDASLCDGLLDVLVIQDMNYPDILELLAAASVTGYANCQELEYFQTKELVIDAGGAAGGGIAVEADGDLIGETPVTFARVSHSLKVFAPPKNWFQQMVTEATGLNG